MNGSRDLEPTLTTLAPPLPVVGKETRIVFDAGLEFLDGFPELPHCGIRCIYAGRIQIHRDRLNLFPGTEDIAMREVLFCAFQGLQNGITQGRGLLTVLRIDHPGQSFGRLEQHPRAHGGVKPV
jgi:hypothetical protein